MTEMNGFHLGQVIGQLLEHSHRQTIILDHQTRVLSDMRDTLSTLPYEMADRLAHHHTQHPQPPRAKVRDWVDLAVALRGPLALALVIFAKSSLPDSLPVIREVIAVFGGH